MTNNPDVSTISPLMATYARFPITLVKGKGSYVWDGKGTKYLDFTAGIATCNLGHVPDVVKAKVEEQLQNLWHCSNLFNIPNQQELAGLLVKNSCGDQVFFCNSGAEANEAAIKIARRYAHKIAGRDEHLIITFKQSFHGRTMATMTATGQEKIQKGFYPLVSGFQYLAYNDFDSLDQLVELKPIAVLLECIQGEGGVIPANPEWLKKLEEVCKKHDILLMVDEIQTGMGRTGTLFSYEQYNIEPDVITVAKGLGSGLPIGAIIAKEHVAKAFDPGSHGSTFGGNPLVTASGVATVNHIVSSGLLDHVKEMAAYLDTKLEELKNKFDCIKDVRGLGLLKGIVVDGIGPEIVKKAIAQQLLILTAGPNVVRILPPLTTTKEEIDEFKEVLDTVFQSF